MQLHNSFHFHLHLLRIQLGERINTLSILDCSHYSYLDTIKSIKMGISSSISSGEIIKSFDNDNNGCIICYLANRAFLASIIRR